MSAMLALGTLTAPAYADGPADQVPGVVGGLLGSPSGSEAPHRARSDYGRTAADDGVLRSGCHRYRYRYRFTPPTHDWVVETFLVDPRGEKIASNAYDSDVDPVANRRAHFAFCRYVTRPGRFSIHAKLIWYDGSGDGHKVWLVPSHFRLRRG